MVCQEEMEGYGLNLKNRMGVGRWGLFSRSREREPLKPRRKERYRECGEEVCMARIRLVRLRGVKREGEKKKECGAGAQNSEEVDKSSDA